MGGSSVLVIAGIWLAVIGYGVLYTGVAKIGGDSSYKLRDAFSGKAPSSGGTGGPGLPDSTYRQRLLLQDAAYRQTAMLPVMGQ